MGTSTFDFGVCDRGQLAFESTADIRGVGLVVRPPFTIDPLLALEGAFRAAVRISERPERAEEVVLLGSAGGSRLAIQGQAITWFAQNPTGPLDLGFEAQLQAVRLVLGGGDGDGFLQKVLSGLDVHAEASLTVGMTLLTGFTVQGSGQLAVDVSTHVDLGPVQIDSLRLALAPADDQIALEAGAVLRVQLGPLRAVVENVGVRGVVRFEEGNLGPADIDTSFKPPVGVGLAIDGGIVKGGGFLSFDPAQGRYAGALQLAVGDFLALNAVGVITTRMPDGSAGFSLLIMITAEFAQGIQLGLGFTLLGVGGLLGLNRTVRLQALIDGVRTGAIDSVMFPRDVLANAPRIISDLETFFPAREGRFLIGPMAKLGWGTPVLVRIVLGVIVEIPGNISIVGAVRVADSDTGGAARLPAGQVRRRDRVRSAAPVLLRHPVRVAYRVRDARRRDGAPARVRRRRELRRHGRRVPPAVRAAAAAVPYARADRTPPAELVGRTRERRAATSR